MQNIYSISYEAFILFLNKIMNRYNNDERKIKYAILDVLTSKESDYNADLQEFLLETGVNLEVCKRLLMFIIVSKSYIMNYYDFVHEINLSYSASALEYLEDLSKEDIIGIFYRPSDITEEIIDDIIAYTSRPYTFEFKSKELIFKDDKVSTLLKLNPFELLDVGDYVPDEKLIESEKFIQDFFDIYDKSISEASENACDQEEYDSIDEYEHAIINQNIQEFFQNDRTKIFLFLSYIISNVYEFLIIEKNSGQNDYREYFDLIPHIEESDVNELCDEFYYNSDFGIKIMDLFVEQNSTLVEGDLLEKREEFEHYGDIKLLRKLNPYYDAEEIVYQKMKETS